MSAGENGSGMVFPSGGGLGRDSYSHGGPWAVPWLACPFPRASPRTQGSCRCAWLPILQTGSESLPSVTYWETSLQL